MLILKYSKHYQLRVLLLNVFIIHISPPMHGDQSIVGLF